VAIGDLAEGGFVAVRGVIAEQLDVGQIVHLTY
jgi:hypothetical protein